MEITRLPPEPVTERITATDTEGVEAVLRTSDDDVCCVLAAQRDGDLHGDDVASHHLVVEVHEA